MRNFFFSLLRKNQKHLTWVKTIDIQEKILWQNYNTWTLDFWENFDETSQNFGVTHDNNPDSLIHIQFKIQRDEIIEKL